MLSVIILILKIIGIAIAAVLGLALFVILLVLFVPIRYRGEAHKGEELQAEGKVSWLFGIILFKVKYTGEKTKYALRICGYKIFSDEPKQKRKKEKHKTSSKKAKVEKKKKPEDSVKKLEQRQKSEVVLKKPVLEEEKDKAHVNQEAADEKRKVSFFEKVRNFFSKLKSIKQKIRDMLNLMKGIFKKAGLIKGFLFDYKNRPGFKVLFKEIKMLLKHLKPTKLKAYVHFGFEDPSQTGQILGAICAVYPQALSKISLNPDFNQKVLEGDVQVRGRIRFFTLLVILVRVIINKQIKIVWENAKWLKEEL